MLIKELEKTRSVYGDRDRIGQVITNLITNAIKYSPQSNKIIIRTKANKKKIGLSVQDFGLGITKDDQAKYLNGSIELEEKNRRHIQLAGRQGSTFSLSLPLESTRKGERSIFV